MPVPWQAMAFSARPLSLSLSSLSHLTHSLSSSLTVSLGVLVCLPHLLFMHVAGPDDRRALSLTHTGALSLSRTHTGALSLTHTYTLGALSLSHTNTLLHRRSRLHAAGPDSLSLSLSLSLVFSRRSGLPHQPSRRGGRGPSRDLPQRVAGLNVFSLSRHFSLT